jgi:hypothetical protein
MPLVKGIQQKYGPDKFQVLLLSVDGGHHAPINEVLRDNKEELKSQGVNWPNVVMPHGFDDSRRLFNADGYGLTLIDPDGIVRDIHAFPEDLEPKLKEIFNKRA